MSGRLLPMTFGRSACIAPNTWSALIPTGSTTIFAESPVSATIRACSTHSSPPFAIWKAHLEGRGGITQRSVNVGSRQ